MRSDPGARARSTDRDHGHQRARPILHPRPPEDPQTPRSEPPTPRSEPPTPPSKPPVPRSNPPAPRSKPPAPRSNPPAPRSMPPAPRSSPPAPRSSPSAPRSNPPMPRSKPPAPRSNPPAPRSNPPMPRSKPPAPRSKPRAISSVPSRRQVPPEATRESEVRQSGASARDFRATTANGVNPSVRRAIRASRAPREKQSGPDMRPGRSMIAKSAGSGSSSWCPSGPSCPSRRVPRLRSGSAPGASSIDP